MERHAEYRPVVRPVFEAISEGRLSAVTSGVTLLEVLVHPLRHGNVRLARSYEAVLTNSRGLRLLDVDREQLREAAGLRARRPELRTPDALQLAAALVAGCSSFVTNDARVPDIPGLKVLQVGAYRR